VKPPDWNGFPVEACFPFYSHQPHRSLQKVGIRDGCMPDLKKTEANIAYFSYKVNILNMLYVSADYGVGIPT
jgi:hypothetical protein